MRRALKVGDEVLRASGWAPERATTLLAAENRLRGAGCGC